MNRSSLLISICLIAIAAASCSDSSEKLELGGGCTLDSDCTNPLSCKFATCHQQCAESRDCPTGQHCVTVGSVGVCQTPAEATCGAAHACSAPLVCRSDDGTCRNACTSSGACAGTGQTCVGGYCLDTTEVANNDGSASEAGVATGGACTLNSDCASSLLCKFGSCHQSCTSSLDCASGRHCVTVNGVAVCQMPSESACGTGGTCAAGLACRTVDNTCRSACTSSAGCLTSQTCTGTVCVDNTELAHNDGSAGAGGAGGAGGGADARSAGDGAAAGSGDAGIDAPAPGVDGAATGSGGSAGSTGDGGPIDRAGGAIGTGGTTGSGGQTGNSCPSPQTQFGNVAQGETNNNFQSGLGVRTADEMLIFDGYLGPDPMAAAADAASPSQVYYVYVQAFDPVTGNSNGPAEPFFKAGDSNTNAITLETAAIAPTGEIILLYYVPAIGTSAAFLSKSTTDAGVAGLQVNRIIQVEVAGLGNQPDCIWSVASKAFVCSWQYVAAAGKVVRMRKFLPDGRSAGGDTDEVPTDRTDNRVQDTANNDVGASGNLSGVGYLVYAYAYPKLTVMDKLGNQVGSTITLQQTPASAKWLTVAGTSAGFVTFYDQAGVAETLVPVDSSGNVAAATGADAGVLPGFHFTGTKTAEYGRAINDDVGGVGGVGLALLFDEGVSFAYVEADGLKHEGPSSMIPHSYASGDQMNITNFAGSFGVSLYSAAAHSTQMAATGCSQ